jgi:DNA-binding NtrC family response regulator
MTQRDASALHSKNGVSDRFPRSVEVTRPLLGHTEQMREVRELVERVADTKVTVLIRGESGTGKSWSPALSMLRRRGGNERS